MQQRVKNANHSTPKSTTKESSNPAANVSSDDNSLVESSDAEGRAIDDSVATTSDSGLEQSSSDELELGGRAAAAAADSAADTPSSPDARPDSVIGTRGDEDEEEGEGTDDGEVTISLNGGDDDGGSEGDDPVERPPEPTVPDERVETTSDEEETVASASQAIVTPPRKDTTAAISELLSEMVNVGSGIGDR